jgi:hypothetical protein
MIMGSLVRRVRPLLRKDQESCTAHGFSVKPSAPRWGPAGDRWLRELGDVVGLRQVLGVGQRVES